ncbi:hypothetical protein [Pedobacter yonginense]|nr:hypothetical protein [Pedobacter yonginense]
MISILIIANENSIEYANDFYNLFISPIYHSDYNFSFNFETISSLNTGLHQSTASIMIVFNPETLFQLHRKIKINQSIIYICNDENGRNLPPTLPYLNKIIMVNGNVESHSFWGTPIELISVIPLNFIHKTSGLKHAQTSDKVMKIRYDIGNEELLTAKKVIKIFNHNPSYQLDIFTKELNEFMLKGFYNENINFYPLNSNESQNITDYDLFIGSDNGIARAIVMHVPAFVVGSHGLGGIVESENLEHYYRTGFKGRIGGILGEEVPVKLLEILFSDAIEKIELHNKNGLALVNPDKVEELFGDSNEISIKKILDVLDYTIRKRHSILDPVIFDSLSIKVNSYIKSICYGQEHIIINNITGRLIGTLNDDEYQIFSKCGQSITVAKLHELTPDFEREDINDFLIQLWENSIVDLTPNTLFKYG